MPAFNIFKSRRRKDTEGITKVQTSGGKYVTKSKKATHPTKGTPLKKGTTVAVTKGKAGSTVPTAGKLSLGQGPSVSKVRMRFEPEDLQKDKSKKGYTVAGRTTKKHEFHTHLKEKVPKESQREAFQASQPKYKDEDKKDYPVAYTTPSGKREHAGSYKREVSNSPTSKISMSKPGLTKKAPTPDKVKVTPPITQKKGGLPKRKQEKVWYLKGQSGKRYGSENFRKKTESGHGEKGHGR